jgi:hypothetical protein
MTCNVVSVRVDSALLLMRNEASAVRQSAGHAALNRRNCEEISKERNVTAIDDRADLVLSITQDDVDQGRVTGAVKEEEFCWKQQVDLDLYHFFALVEDGDWPNAEKKYREDDAIDKDTKYTNAYHSIEHFALHPSSSKSHYFPFMRENNAMKIRSLLNDTFKVCLYSSLLSICQRNLSNNANRFDAG